MPLTKTLAESLDQQIAKVLPKIRLRDVCSPFRFSRTQKILFFLIVGLGSLWIVSLSINTPEPLILNAPDSSNESKHPIASKANLLLPQEELISLFNSRHLFKGVEPPPPPVPKQQTIKLPGITEKIRNLILSGVLQEDPIQAMIEVKDSGESYCVKAGEPILDMEVVSIALGQVTLKYQDETAVLR